MKLHSPYYLNPFQGFPERGHDAEDVDSPEFAIEDNLTRSVFSAIANAEHVLALELFLRELANHGSPFLQTRMAALVETLRETDVSSIECGLQICLPAELSAPQVILIGISSSHNNAWTHDQRLAPKTYPRPDAWIYVPGQVLFVFECKDDEHPLDATQMSAYAHTRGLLTPDDRVPRADEGRTLLSIADAKAVQRACADLVLDVPWSTVIDALKRIHGEERVGERGRWLCGQAAFYLQWHVKPPFRGVSTILDWLKGPDTPDRRNHLRVLVRKLGEDLKQAANRQPGGITFALDGNRSGDLARGAGSAIYVNLKRDGQLLQLNWAGRIVCPVLWFNFDKTESERIGLDYYIQATGSHISGKGDAESDWNQASGRHLACAERFEAELAKLVRSMPSDRRMIVTTVRFRGNKKNWQGGGVEVPEGPNFETTPQSAVELVRQHRDKLWSFPRIGASEATRTVTEAALQVRKPAVSFPIPLDYHALLRCGDGGLAFQDLLQEAVNGIAVAAGAL